MKQITFIMMLFVASMGLQAQNGTWDFNDNTTQGWTSPSGGSSGGVLTPGATTVTFSWELGTKPKISNLDTNIDADVKKVLSIRIKNNSEITELKIKHAKVSDGSNRYVKFTIDANKDSFETYYFDLTNDYWGGTQSFIDIIMSPAGSITSSASSLEIDNIEFIESIPTTEKTDFQFSTDGDSEGFIGKNLGASGAVTSGGNITLDLTKADSYPHIYQGMHHVVAENEFTLEVRLKNLSPEDDTMFLLLKDATLFEVPITTSDSDFNTYKIKLDTAATWTGEITGYKIRFGDASRVNPNNPESYGVSSGQGSVIIDYVKFTNEIVEALSNESIKQDDKQINIYPNPVINMLTVNTSSKVNSLIVYNVTGQEVLRADKASINTSSLTKGVYILKVSLENGNISTKRFVKD